MSLPQNHRKHPENCTEIPQTGTFPSKPLDFSDVLCYDFDDNISNRSKEWTKKSTLSFCITGIFRQKGGGNPWQEEMNMNPGSRNF